MINWDELKDRKWIVAVSGGADSMALLDLCVQHHITVAVCHVNYQKRDSADRDMNGVKAYCEEHHVPFYCHRVDHYEEGYNFQAQAREIRYRFFVKCAKELDAHGILVAHQKDDVIETYLMQKRRGGSVHCYGICEETEMYGVLIKRILLSYTKKELEQYCEQHQVRYYQDESNFENHYLRNRLRHQYIDAMDREEKNRMIALIAKENEALNEWRSKVESYALPPCFNQAQFCSIPPVLQNGVLRQWILANTSLVEVSEKNLSQLCEMLNHKTGNFKHNINEYFYLRCEYGQIGIDENRNYDYEYSYDSVEYHMTPYFTIAQKGKTIEGVTLSSKDFPITIRNARKGDKIKLRMGTKKVSRFFIDNKISHKDRQTWPVVVNSEGNVIFVHKIGCDIEHYSNNSTIFVLK